MSPRFSILAVVCCIIASSCFGQQVQSQFPELILSENFEHSNNYWATIANSENLFIIQEGEYILNRKSSNSPYAVIGNFNQPVQNFRLVTSLKIEKSSGENPVMGVAFLLQSNNQGGFILEFNTQQQYRIKKILAGSYKYLSGTPTNAGWVSSEHIHKKNLFNLVEIKSDMGVYDIFVNNEYLQSFREQSSAGTMGYIIGAGTQGRVDFMYIFGKAAEKYIASSSNVINPGQPSSVQTQRPDNSPDVLALAESIIKLKTQINDLKQENEELKWSINASIEEEKTQKENEEFFKGQIRTLQSKLNATRVSFDSLQTVNKKLEKYKKIVGDDENADLIITLSKTVKAEKKTNEELSAKTTELESQNLALKTELQQLKSQLAKITSLLTGELPAVEPKKEEQQIKAAPQQNNSNGFVLPSDPN
ncbi:MAG: hypothetical protein HKN22_02765 [Bacteroidia bacterium]|nr:hypothetical protein [Bacteroidia bacterium]